MLLKTRRAHYFDIVEDRMLGWSRNMLLHQWWSSSWPENFFQATILIGLLSSVCIQQRESRRPDQSTSGCFIKPEIIESSALAQMEPKFYVLDEWFFRTGGQLIWSEPCFGSGEKYATSKPRLYVLRWSINVVSPPARSNGPNNVWTKYCKSRPAGETMRS